MQSAKETATNAAASAKSGLDKTKATMQEKGEKMTTRDPQQKEMATEEKQARLNEAERQKHTTKESAKAHGGTGYGEETGYPSETTGAEGVGGGATGETGRTGVADPNVHPSSGAARRFVS